MAEERQEHNAKMKKMEAEMEQVFEMKVKEKRQKLKDSEADVSSFDIRTINYMILYNKSVLNCNKNHSPLRKLLTVVIKIN